MDKVPNRSNWSFDVSSQDLSLDKLSEYYIKDTLIRTQKMFKYNNLPKTIPKEQLELLLQRNGYAVITKVDDELYAFYGGLGGEPNAYYLPTIATVANPALKFSKSMVIDKECVVIKNDVMFMGLMPLIESTSYLLAQADISFKYALINGRMKAIVTAPNDETKASLDEMFRQIEKGSSLKVVVDDDLMNELKVSPYGSNDNGIDIIELKQYIIGSFYQKLGIQSNFNMKREALNSAESALNDDILYPLIDEMLEERQKGVEKINELYGTNISVELSSIWKQLRDQEEQAVNVNEDKENKKDEVIQDN